MKCSVCGFELGTSLRLENEVKKAGFETPSDWGIDPLDVTWVCGDHKEDINDETWDENTPYWYG